MRSDAAASPRLGGATPSTSAPTAYQITLTHHQKSVKVPLYRIFPVERHFHWVSVAPGGNLEREMTTGGARAGSGRDRIRRPGTSVHRHVRRGCLAPSARLRSRANALGAGTARASELRQQA